MVDKNKVIYLNSKFTAKSLPSDNGENVISIEGYASTNDVDRQGDVVPSSVWQKGLANYLKNPIILAYHDHTQPVGRMVDHKVDEKGLWIKASVSDAAGSIYKLVKNGILTRLPSIFCLHLSPCFAISRNFMLCLLWFKRAIADQNYFFCLISFLQTLQSFLAHYQLNQN